MGGRAIYAGINASAHEDILAGQGYMGNVIATMVLAAISAGILGILYVLATAVPMISAMALRSR